MIPADSLLPSCGIKDIFLYHHPSCGKKMFKSERLLWKLGRVNPIRLPHALVDKVQVHEKSYLQRRRLMSRPLRRFITRLFYLCRYGWLVFYVIYYGEDLMEIYCGNFPYNHSWKFSFSKCFWVICFEYCELMVQSLWLPWIIDITNLWV